MKRVLVTGANGFIGRHVGRAYAAAGHEVFGIGHGFWTDEDASHWGVSRWYELDVSLASLAGHAGRPDVIVHCAGSGSVGFSLENPAQDFERTVETTLDVLEFIRTSSPATVLVYPSSAAVYGRAVRVPIEIDAPLEPISPYGVHKRMAEDLCRSYAKSFELNVAIVRIFSAFGPELRKQLLWDACRKAARGTADFAGTGRETRDWVHVDDVANLLRIASDHASVVAPAVNCGSGIEIQTGQILETLLNAYEPGMCPTFSGVTRSGDPERYAGDISGARNWGWKPQKAWSAGVIEYAQWFRERGS